MKILTVEEGRAKLMDAAKEAGVTLKLDDNRHYAVVMWRSHGPVIRGCKNNRVLLCDSYFETKLAIEAAGNDARASLGTNRE